MQRAPPFISAPSACGNSGEAAPLPPRRQQGALFDASMRGASSAPQALAAAGGAGGVYVPLSTGSPMAAAGAGAAAQAPASSAPLPASAPLAKFKVVFLGDSGAGKTSLIKTFIYGPGQFEANYSATIGIDFLAKVRAGKESSGSISQHRVFEKTSSSPPAALCLASPRAPRLRARSRPFFSRTARCGCRFGTRRGRSASAHSSLRTSATCVVPRSARPLCAACAEGACPRRRQL